MKEVKEFVVTDKDLVAVETVIYNSPMLQVLKDKGAPIKGVLNLEFEKGWDFSCWRDASKQQTHFKFWRNE